MWVALWSGAGACFYLSALFSSAGVGCYLDAFFSAVVGSCYLVAPFSDRGAGVAVLGVTFSVPSVGCFFRRSF